MKKNLVLLSLLFFTFTLVAQEPHSCPVNHVENIVYTKNEDGTAQGETTETCFGCDWHSLKTVKLVFHVIRDLDGEINFGPNDEPLLQSIVDVANEKLSNNKPPTQPAVPNQVVPEINVRFELTEINFHQQENWAYPNIDYPSLDPDLLDIFLVEQAGDWFGDGCGDSEFCQGAPFCCVGGWAGGGLNNRAVMNRGFFRYVFDDLQPNCYAIFDGDEEAAWLSTYADVLIHEIGHLCGLNHLNVDDDCDDTPLLSNVCSSNNIMSGCACNKGNLTCCQVEKIHAALSSQDFPFVEETQRDCEASFITFPLDCEYFFFNNSTHEQSPESCEFTWCVKDLSESGDVGLSTYHSYNLEFRPPCNGDFQVCLEVQDPSGCIDVHCEVITVDCTSCECVPGPNPCDKEPPVDYEFHSGGDRKINNPIGFSISPNPASNEFIIDISSLDISQKHTIIIYDLLGKIIYNDQFEIDNNNKRIDSSRLKNGVYLIQITDSSNRTYTKELVIAR